MPVTQHIIKRTIHWLTQGLPVSHWQAAGLPKRQNNISHIFFTLRVLQCKPSGILSSPYSHPIAHLCAIIGHGAMPVDPSHSTESLTAVPGPGPGIGALNFQVLDTAGAYEVQVALFHKDCCVSPPPLTLLRIYSLTLMFSMRSSGIVKVDLIANDLLSIMILSFLKNHEP